jgi:hypothetical protein
MMMRAMMMTWMLGLMRVHCSEKCTHLFST